jgi:hypothetical protein
MHVGPNIGFVEGGWKKEGSVNVEGVEVEHVEVDRQQFSESGMLCFLCI